MSRIMVYRTVRVRQNAWPEATAALREKMQGVERDGGRLFGIFLGHIGLGANEGIVATQWPDEDAAAAEGGLCNGIDEIVDSDVVFLRPTVRPKPDDPAPTEQGVYAHRWFDVKESDWEEFLQLSDEAWPSMEAAFDARIIGFWRATNEASDQARVLLLTWYRDLSQWEASRWWGNTRDGRAEEAMQRFQRRRQITIDTVVRTTRLAP